MWAARARYGGEHMWERPEAATSEAAEAVADIATVRFDPDPHSCSGSVCG
jgi:hypothetical protein